VVLEHVPAIIVRVAAESATSCTSQLRLLVQRVFVGVIPPTLIVVVDAIFCVSWSVSTMTVIIVIRVGVTVIVVVVIVVVIDVRPVASVVVVERLIAPIVSVVVTRVIPVIITVVEV
jgi:hypothetical protein